MTRLTNNIQAGEVSFHRGPSLGALCVVFISLFVLSLVVTGVMTGGAHFPTPYEPVALARVARANHCSDLRTFCSEPGLSNGRDPPPAGAIPSLHLADRRGLHDAQVEGKARN